MEELDNLIKEYYKKCVGLPTNNPIVRNNQENDAFEVVVLETLYGKEKSININKMSASELCNLSTMIVAPPDDGIDIVIEHEDIEENTYDFIQVKNSTLSPSEIKMHLSYMEKSVSNYIKNPKNSTDNFREVMSHTDFSASDKDNCKFILVHRGIDNYYNGQDEKKEQIITGTELVAIRNSSSQSIPKVAKESFGSDSFNNFNIYEESENEPAIVLNLCGYDLAKLAIKYTNTSLGRNILFGQNLRESLGSKSDTYKGMANTIKTEPEKFWFYNNGITILAEDYDTETQESNNRKVEKIILKNFSIINGAQTTSALGQFLKNANMDNNEEDIANLKKVYVLVRILKVNNEEFRSRIAIYNNTQNPITTRDMASNRAEQLRLHNGLISGDAPHIYMEIRRGMKLPNDVKLQKHQITTNEELAQLAFAGFKRNPFDGKDKKKALFDTDYKHPEYLLNEYYHVIFHDDIENPQGILFQKNKDDINELLFVHHLFKESKKNLRKTYQQRIADAQKKIESNDPDSKKLEMRISDYTKRDAICNICAFYCIDYYYAFKSEFSNVDVNVKYQYDAFYSDKKIQQLTIEEFRNLFLANTINIINKLTINSPNLNTWIRDKKSTKLFNDAVDEQISSDISLEDLYKDYVKKVKK